MAQQTISAPERSERQRPGRGPGRGRRFLLAAAAVSLGLHLIVLIALLAAPRLRPRQEPAEQGTVELLMVEQKGNQPQAPAPSSDSGGEPAAPAAAPVPQTPPQPVTTARAEEPAPLPPQPATSTPSKPEEQPQKEQAKQAPVFNLAGTDSESNAYAMGENILPASPDNRFRNRPPIYPPEAERRRDHGAVIVLIHVAATGLPTGAEILRSSGVASLDEAALTAVRKWRFHPAMRDGQSIPFDLPFQFVFQAD